MIYKPYIDISTDLRRKAKNDFVKTNFKLMSNAVFWKIVRHIEIKLVTIEKRINYLVLELNYYATMLFLENLWAMKMTKTEVLMNNPL